jgi:hypothetical protein
MERAQAQPTLTRRFQCVHTLKKIECSDMRGYVEKNKLSTQFE